MGDGPGGRVEGARLEVVSDDRAVAEVTPPGVPLGHGHQGAARAEPGARSQEPGVKILEP